MERLKTLDISLSEKLDRITNPNLFLSTQSKLLVRPKMETYSSPDWTKLWITRIKKNSRKSKFSRTADHFGLAQANNTILNKEGVSSLQQASYYGKVKIMKRLISEGADVNHEDWSGSTALLYAIQSNQPESVRILMQVKELAVSQKFGDRHETALIKAIKLGHTEIVKELCKRPEAILKQDIDGRTPLFHAVIKGNCEIVKTLLEIGGSEEDLIDYKGHNAIELAISIGEIGTVRTLLSYYNLDITQAIGQSLLILACYINDIQIVKSLLVRKMPTHCVCNDSQKTPIFIAYSLGFTEIVYALLEVANSEILDHKSSEDDSILLMATRRNDQILVSRLLKKGADPNIQTSFNRTPLLIASEMGHDTIVKLLLQYNAELDFQDFEGESALMLAVTNKHKNAIRALLEYKPLTCIMNNRNKRAVDLTTNLDIKMMIEEYMFNTPEKQSPEFNIEVKRIVRQHSKRSSTVSNDSIFKLFKSSTKYDYL